MSLFEVKVKCSCDTVAKLEAEIKNLKADLEKERSYRSELDHLRYRQQINDMDMASARKWTQDVIRAYEDILKSRVVRAPKK